MIGWEEFGIFLYRTIAHNCCTHWNKTAGSDQYAVQASAFFSWEGTRSGHRTLFNVPGEALCVLAGCFPGINILAGKVLCLRNLSITEIEIS